MTLSWPGSVRKIITIDEEKCTGCGECIPDCPEGALRIVDGKARLVSESLCDGLGACVGRCPTGAMNVEERAAEGYDEEKALANIVKRGPEAVRSHLLHLRNYGQVELLETALEYLKKNDIGIPSLVSSAPACSGGCPGAAVADMRQSPETDECCHDSSGAGGCLLSNWPVQITLVPPGAPFLQDADVVLAADCVPFAYPSFHRDLLKDRILLVGCPKLDDAQFYINRLADVFRQNSIRSLTCVRMEVPCCSGMVAIARAAMKSAGKSIPFEEVVVGIDGRIKG